MDDHQTYLLNGLLARHFGLGRIVRFRQVPRGRQADTFELFTAQEKEYLVHLYPQTFTPEHLDFIARTVNALDENRFTVVPFLQNKTGSRAAEGPQNSRMLVSLAPAGSALAPHDFTEHDISQIGLRLAWMHRLLAEQLPDPASIKQPSLADRFAQQFLGPNATNRAHLERLHSFLSMSTPQGWAHGDIQPAALLHDADHQLRTITDWALLHPGSSLEDIVEAFLMLATDSSGSLQKDRGHALLEAYGSLVPIARLPWTPVVATWCAQHLLDHAQHNRPLPPGLPALIESPERLATALASCT